MVVQKQFVILIVEDNPTGIASLVGILAPVYELVIAKTLAEAKQYLSTDVDVVLLGGSLDALFASPRAALFSLRRAPTRPHPFLMGAVFLEAP